MPHYGSVNYHVHKPERQAFKIDADGIVGNLVSPELIQTAICVNDIRSGEAAVSFQADGLVFSRLPSAVESFSQNDVWKPAYNAELTAFLKKELGARDVAIFDHTVRTDDTRSVRKPARNVHSDYSPDGARQRLIDILGEDTAAEWRKGHYAFVNIWRPIGAAINSAPLGFLRPSTVPPEDWLLLDLIYPDRTGQIMGIVGNPAHEWVYLSCMTPEEIACFNIYDSQGLPSIAHSAIDLVEDETLNVTRKSIESRTLIRYA